MEVLEIFSSNPGSSLSICFSSANTFRAKLNLPLIYPSSA
jgi:hypothetical protein